MPYVKQVHRAELNKIVASMLMYGIEADGDLNYVLFKYCKDHIEPGYNNYKNYCGELRQCATEIERRLMASHEDKKMRENGDV